MTRLPTEPIRQEHRDLLPHLYSLETAAIETPEWDQETATRRLAQIVEFLRDHLVPHAKAEDEHLYPKIDAVCGGTFGTATMRIDHQELATRIERLVDVSQPAADAWDDPVLRHDIALQLGAIAAIVLLHFRKEEEALLPILDDSMTPDEVDDLYANMGHGHGEH